VVGKESVWFTVQRTPIGNLPAIVYDPKDGKPKMHGLIFQLRLDTMSVIHSLNYLMCRWERQKLPGQKYGTSL